MTGFRFPDGVWYEGEDDGGRAAFRVSMPLDEAGFLGRQCPACRQLFRISGDDYEALPDDLEMWCVYCGAVGDHSDFITDQQEERVMQAAGDYAVQLAGRTLDTAFRRMARRSRGSAVSVSYRSKPFYPKALPEIDEEELIRERSCASCGVRYAVFGEHRFCPACGPMAPLAVAEDALAAEVTRLDAVTDLPVESIAKLRERGSLDRILVDTIKNVVGIVETIADAAFRSAVSASDSVLKGKGNVFQRLDETADLFEEHRGVDLRRELGSDWDALLATWAARHVFTHNDGIVDSRYLKAVPNSPLRGGQRLRVTESEARAAIDQARSLCRAVAAAADMDPAGAAHRP